MSEIILELENSKFENVYNELISDVIKNTDFKKIHNVLKMMEIEWKSIKSIPSTKQIQGAAYQLLKDALSILNKDETERVSLNKEGLYVNIYGLNYSDIELAGSIELSFKLENKNSYFKNILVFDEYVPEVKELSIEERISIIENNLRKLEKRIGVSDEE